MKKILMSLFVLGLFAFSFQAHASVLSDALLKIENLTKEVTKLKTQLKASVGDIVLGGTATGDTTPRIMFWPGAVNQHVDADGVWRTDPDGKSGGWPSTRYPNDYGDRQVEYCNKFYSNVTSVEEYKNETISTWRAGGNTGASTGTRMSYKCVGANGVNNDDASDSHLQDLPDLIVSDFSWSPSSPTATYTSNVTTLSGYLHGNVTIKNIGNVSVSLPEGMNVYLYKSDESNIVGGFSLGTEEVILSPGGKKTYSFTTTASPNITETPGTFSLTMKVDDPSGHSSSLGVVRELNEDNNTLTRQITIKDGNNNAPSITVLSPNGGESYKAGDKITVKWKTENIPANTKITVILESPRDLVSNFNPTTYYVSNSGSTTFTLPEESDFIEGYSIPWGKNFRFEVVAINSASNGSLALDFSDDTFTIKSAEQNDTPSITVLSPNGGESYKAGDTVTVRWTTKNIPANTQMFIRLDGDYTIYDKALNNGTTVGKNDGYEVVTLPTNDTWPGMQFGKKYKISIQTYPDEKTTGYSDGLFSVNDPSVSTTSAANNDTGVSSGFSVSSRTLKVGVKGDDVKTLQSFLNINADGSFGPMTKAKVIEWQKANGLTADGAFGKMSRQKAGLTE